MGLDQYAKWTTSDDVVEDFFYWRKSNHVQDWMQRLYAEKTGVNKPEEFNCVELELTQEDVLRFVDDINNRKMQTVSGFFFGPTDYDPFEERERDLEFASKAMYHLWLGRKVVYSSWW